jgi:hypothetical protein
MAAMRRAIVVIAIIITFFLAQPIAQLTVTKAVVWWFPKTNLEVHYPVFNPYISLKPTVDFSFDYEIFKNSTQVDYFSYNLDGNTNIRITNNVSDINDALEYDSVTHAYDKYDAVDYSVIQTIDNLVNGNHTVNFYVNFLNGTASEIIHETIIVDPTYQPPAPQMISPLNQTTYNTKDLK